MGCSKLQIAVIVLIVLVILMFGALLAVIIGFTADIENFKVDTNSVQQEQQIGQNNINSSFETRFQQIMQDFSAAQLYQQQQLNIINSSFEEQLQQLREEIGLSQQQQLQRQKAINSSFQERLQQLNANLNFTQERLQQLNQNINFTQQQQITINSSLEARLQELGQNIITSQQQQLEQQMTLNASFDMRLEELIQDLNSTQQQQNAINSSLVTRLQELRQETNSALQLQLDQQNAINSSFDTRLQELSQEFNSAQQLQQNQLSAVNSSLETRLQELGQNVNSAQQQLNVLNSSIESGLQNLNQDINFAREERQQQQSAINSSLERLQELLQDISSLNSSIASINNVLISSDMKTQAKILQLNSSLEELYQLLQQQISTRDIALNQLNVSLSQQINDSRVRIQEIITILERHGSLQTFPASSCNALLPSLPSDFYWLRASNGSAVRVFCDMDLSCDNVTGGWARVALLDFNNTNNINPCPSGFVVRNDANLQTCVTATTGCTQLDTLSTFGLSYSKICGRVIAYQFGTTEAFSRSLFLTSLTVDDQYLDGISLTHGSSPRNHIWSFAGGVTQSRTDRFGCPCAIGSSVTAPSFVGSNYFCDSAASSIASGMPYPNNPLFDGIGCDASVTNCCSFNNPPWFYRQLPQSTTDNMEIRACQDEATSNEGVPIQVIDLYIQ